MVPTDALGVQVGRYLQIIVFRNERDFLDALKENLHLEAVFGSKEHEKRLFPNLFIVGIKDN